MPTPEVPEEDVVIPHDSLNPKPWVKIGEGGFGTVYKTKYNGEDVAVKVLKDKNNNLTVTQEVKEEKTKVRNPEQAEAQAAEAAAKRERPFNVGLQEAPKDARHKYESKIEAHEREKEMLKDLDHERILKYIGICKMPGSGPPAIVTRFERGKSLFHALAEVRLRLEQKSRLRILVDIASGLDYLHGKGYIHGDLKSSNVLMTEPFEKNGDFAELPKGAYAVLSDFGQSMMFKSLPATDSDPGSRAAVKVPGTIEYMAPEAYDGAREVLLSAVDVYAFGMVMYELLEGRIPWGGRTANIKDAVIDGHRPEWAATDVPEELKDLAKKCWDGNPEARPKSRQILDTLRMMIDPESGPVIWPAAVKTKYWAVDAPRRPPGIRPQNGKYRIGSSISDKLDHLHSSKGPAAPEMSGEGTDRSASDNA